MTSGAVAISGPSRERPEIDGGRRERPVVLADPFSDASALAGIATPAELSRALKSRGLPGHETRRGENG